MKPYADVNGVSKAYAMTAAYSAWLRPEKADSARCAGTVAIPSNPCTGSQWAASRRLNARRITLQRIQECSPRRAIWWWTMLNGDRRRICPKPEGAFLSIRSIAGLIGQTTKSGVNHHRWTKSLPRALLEDTGVAWVWRGFRA